MPVALAIRISLTITEFVNMAEPVMLTTFYSNDPVVWIKSKEQASIEQRPLSGSICTKINPFVRPCFFYNITLVIGIP